VAPLQEEVLNNAFENFEKQGFTSTDWYCAPVEHLKIFNNPWVSKIGTGTNIAIDTCMTVAKLFGADPTDPDWNCETDEAVLRS